MVLREQPKKAYLISSPHPRGDGPTLRPRVILAMMFSPPAWGWSGIPKGGRVHALVLPTRVGMVRRDGRHQKKGRGSPHPRGDGPYLRWTSFQSTMFSPPAWGWSGVDSGETKMH